MLDFGMVLVLVIVGVGFFVVRQQRQISLLKRHDYAWYKNKHPQLMQDGKVRCFRCKSTAVGAELLKQGSYLRRHYCRQCGAPLYFSQE